MSVSLKFQEKVEVNEREIIGLWVSFVKFITELYSLTNLVHIMKIHNTMTCSRMEIIVVDEG